MSKVNQAPPRDTRSPPRQTSLDPEDIARIVGIRHDAPHRVLGPHRLPDGTSTAIRAFVPHARLVTVRLLNPQQGDYPMSRVHPLGLFETVVPSAEESDPDYRLLVRDGQGTHFQCADPYAFQEPWFGREDEDSFVAGSHCRLHGRLGSHAVRRRGIEGVMFAVWAPHAERVSVVGTFNAWDGRCHPMRRLEKSGVWELFIPGVREGELYKFEVRRPEGAVFLKGDPFAFRTEVFPATASIVTGPEPEYRWTDAAWVAGDRGKIAERRLPVIRHLDLDRLVHSGEAAGERQNAGKFACSASLAALRAQGYTHVELTLAQHSPPGNAGVFAPNEIKHAATELMAAIDACHAAGLGAILPIADSQAPALYRELAWFDGTPLYQAETDGGTGADLLATEKGEVQSFVLSNAVYWFETYHVDGWRTDQRCAAHLRRLSDLEPARFMGIPVLVAAPFSGNPLPEAEMSRLVAGRHDAPFSVLGPHYSATARELTIRAWLPDAERVWARSAGAPECLYGLRLTRSGGWFEITLAATEGFAPYRLGRQSADGIVQEFHDPYAFRHFAFSTLDQQLFAAGRHYRIYEKLGAHPVVEQGIEGVRFAVWAPNAAGASVVGPFNGWDGRRHPMQRHGASGVWEIFIPELYEGALYKYEIRTGLGDQYLKSDPYAFHTEVPPATASVVYSPVGKHQWRDQAWMEGRGGSRLWEQPVAIYEVHAGSWMRRVDGSSLSYGELAERLVAYVEELGFTHIELLPVAEHPYEPSWGYQVTGYYAPTSRYGRPEELMALIDLCHQRGIGVLLDWVPGHFPKDAHALAWFDGTGLYEHADPRKGEHRDWGTLVFNYGRHEVDNFLIANALFWLEQYHFDGLRVDAVASMLYLDYSRHQPGDWIPNQYGGRENLEAIEFLKHANVVVHREHPGVMMIAEESTAWPNVSRPVDREGLGFGYKWNMGWMHDILTYLAVPPEHRSHRHHTLTFSLVYAFAENYVLSLSHDEVVHLKRSLLNKMPGDEWEKFANLRLLYAFMYGHPGKKLLFMGAEFGQRAEWNHASGLEWKLLEREPHRQLQSFVADLNRLYRANPAFFEVDFKALGFEWLQADTAEYSIIAFLRKARDPRSTLLFVLNFSAVSRPWHRVGVPYPVVYQTIFTTNAHRYGGADNRTIAAAVQAENAPWDGREFSLQLPIPALSALVLRPAAPAV